MTVSCSHQFSHSLAFSLFCVCLKPLDGRGAVAGPCVSKGLGDACRDPVWSRPQLWAFQRSGHKAWKIFLVGGFQAMPLFRRWLWRPARYREVQGQYAFCAWVGGDAPRLGVWLPLRKSGAGEGLGGGGRRGILICVSWQQCDLSSAWGNMAPFWAPGPPLSPALWLSVREWVFILLFSSVTQRSERPPLLYHYPAASQGQ